MKHQNTVSLRISERDYTVACPPEAEEALESAARELDRRMVEIRRSGKVFGADRVAVMAALNIIHELRQQLDHQTVSNEALDRMTRKIDDAM